MNILSINVNGLRLRTDKVLTCIQENNFYILCLQVVYSDQERYDFEKKARGIGYSDTNGGYTGTGIIVRQSLQNMGTEYLKVDNPIFLKKG